MPGKKRRQHERDHLIFGRIHADRFRRHFVVTHGQKAAAIGRVDQVRDDINRQRRKKVGPKKRGVTIVDRKAARSADRIGVLDDDADDLAESQRRDREIIAAQAQRGNANEQSGERGEERTREQGRREKRVCR